MRPMARAALRATARRDAPAALRLLAPNGANGAMEPQVLVIITGLVPGSTYEPAPLAPPVTPANWQGPWFYPHQRQLLNCAPKI